MIKEHYVLDGESLVSLAGLKGHRIGFVGSPTSEFRDSWKTWGQNIVIEVGDRDYLFGAEETMSTLEAVAMDIPQFWARSSEEFQGAIAGFPRFDWWKGLVVDHVLIARDTYSFSIPAQSGEIVMDRAIILVTERKTISISVVEAHDGAGLLLAHEPTVAGRLGIFTQPAARDLAWVDNMEHSRQILRLEDLKTQS